MTPDERRTAIVEAVLPLIERSGGDVTTREIAEAAGIAEGTIFRVFPDKRALLLATAEQVVAPVGWREEMAAMLADRAELRGKVQATVEQMVERSRRVMLVMAALRTVVLTEGAPARDHGSHAGSRPGPPRFLLDAGRLLHEALVELVFEPHGDELAVPPERAARALRSLVTGACHPGSMEDEPLRNEEITDLLLHGIHKEPR
jgi:AcrR family transcriptional regulator